MTTEQIQQNTTEAAELIMEQSREIHRLRNKLAIVENANWRMLAALDAAKNKPDNQTRVANWMRLAGQVVNETPTMPDFATKCLRSRLILEESLEAICKGFGLVVIIHGSNGEFKGVLDHTDKLAFGVSPCIDPSLIELADGLADLEVVAKGTAAACGIPSQACFDEVMDSNDSKFVWTHQELLDAQQKTCWRVEPHGELSPGVFQATVLDSGGKVMKSPSYKKANLQPILEGKPQP